MAEPLATAPIGVFDSGIGGLSVLQALLQALPEEHFVYLADAGYAPYGEQDRAQVLHRAEAIARYLLETQQVKALVIACNTATAAAVGPLRERYLRVPIVGIEPALKPAAALSRTGHIGVLATRGTLQSEKFAALLARQSPNTHFVLQPCDGLAAAIEQDDTATVARLAAHYLDSLGPLGHQDAEMDAVVLGCTHYALVGEVFGSLLAGRCSLHEAGIPVAHRARQVLAERGWLCPAQPGAGSIQLLSTGDPALLHKAAKRWLCQAADVQSLALAS